ncbi:FecR family protein [Bdellovibrionota bacterium FG-1]
MLFFRFPVLVFLSFFAWAAAGAASESVHVESLAGDGVVFAISAEAPPRRLAQGDDVPFWQSVQTSSRSAARIKYPDDSIIIVGRDTKFQVLPKLEGTQFNQLDWGQVRAQIEKETKPDPKAPPRFVIRTKTATMGVRGTEFVAGFDAASGSSQLHTLEGVVEFAKDEGQVMSWKGTPVAAGQQATIGATMDVPAPEPYNPKAYLEEMKASQPEIDSLVQLPKNGGKSGGAPGGASDDPDPSHGSEVSQQTPKSPEKEIPSEPRLQLLQFRVGAMGVFQGSGGQFFSPLASFNPSLRLLGPLSIRAYLGGFLLKRQTTGESFIVPRAGLLLALGLPGPLEVEAGALYERWAVPGSDVYDGPALSANLGWKFGPTSWLERIWVGGAVFKAQFMSQAQPLEILSGIGLRF